MCKVAGYGSMLLLAVTRSASGRGAPGIRPAACALAVAVLAFMPDVAAAAPDPPDPGQTTSGTVASNGTDYPYLLYTPTTYVPGSPAPLVVMVHGCQTTAEQEMELTRFNQVAEREGFVVLYPEVNAVEQAQPGPIANCWQFFDPAAYFRGNGDPAAIAAMTQAVMRELTIDAERVYAIGVSAGGLMVAVDAAAYSDLYAAVGLVASAGFADGTCFTTGVGTPVEASAQLAFEQMGPRARVVPIIAIGSDADLAFPATCTDKALEQGLRTNNLVLSGSQDGPIALTPAAVEEKQVPDGLGYTVSRYRDPDGCLVGERWIIHGMPHAWPGGTTDPEYAGYTDTRAPSGAEGTWEFLERYRMSETGMPCAEAPAHADGERDCVRPKLRIRRLGIGRGRVGAKRATLIQRLGAATSPRPRVLVWCVRGGGRLVAVLSNGRAELVGTTGRRHRTARGVGPRSTLGALRKTYPRQRRIARSLAIAGPSSPLVFRRKAGRIRSASVASGRLLDAPPSLRKALRRGGL